MIKYNYPLSYYFKNSIDYSIKQDILQLKIDGCLFSDLDINDIYIEHKDYIINYIYNLIDIE